MKPISQYITLMLATLLGFALSACGSDPEATSTGSEMSISFRVETRNGEESNAGEGNGDSAPGYEDATAWENFIDIDNGDYRIAFFDYENRCITPFKPTEIAVVDNTNYVDYTLKGKVPGILTMYSDFKIVVLANWGTDNYPEITTGVTTIDDLCCPKTGSLGRFHHFISSDYQISEGQRYVPMYGVKEYKGVIFGVDNENNPTVLYEGGNFGPVNMLRSIAKVEVIFDTSDTYELDPSKTISITNYNSYGYCAPEGCYRERDYYHSSWIQDYRQGWLHLVGGCNDGLSKEPLDMAKTTAADGKVIWVAYLPEYRNLNITDNKSDCENGTGSTNITPARIAVPFLRNGESHLSYIDFATYKDGEPGDRINIERNNLYRFTITHVDQGVKWKVEALSWNCLKHDEIAM